MVHDDPILPYDNGEVPKPNEVVDGSIPHCEIVSLLDKNTLTMWSNASCDRIYKKIGLRTRKLYQFHERARMECR
jgi:hypothetical protein